MRELSALCSQNMWWVPLCLWHWLFLWGSRCIQHFPPSGMFPLLPEGSENINQTLHHTQFSSVTEKKQTRKKKLTTMLVPNIAFWFLFSHLYFVQHSSAVHSAGHIHRVTPNIILRFMSSNHSCNHWPVVYSCKWSATRGEQMFETMRWYNINVFFCILNIFLEFIQFLVHPIKNNEIVGCRILDTM